MVSMMIVYLFRDGQVHQEVSLAHIFNEVDEWISRQKSTAAML